jgi:ectoine hydroxylase
MTLAESRIQDRYPTRTLVAESVERVDPTVWSTGQSGPIGQSGPLDSAELAGFEANGHLIMDGLLNAAEVETYRRELARLSSDERLKADQRTIVERESNQVRSIFEVHRISELIAELVRDPRLADRARQILGSDVYVHQSRVNFMPGFAGTGFYWHSDFETWHAEDGMPAPRAVSISVALADNHPFNGGLMVMPGSHRTFVGCAGETPADHYKASLKSQEIGVPSEADLTRLAAEHGIDQFTGAAGAALVFDSNTMHGSGNNITPFPRSNIFVVFNSVDNTLVEPFAAPAPRPTFIASRDFTPVPR